MQAVVRVSVFTCMVKRPPGWKLCANLVPANSSLGEKKKEMSGTCGSVGFGAKSKSHTH